MQGCFFHNLCGKSLWLTKSGGYSGNSCIFFHGKTFTGKFILDSVFLLTANSITDVRLLLILNVNSYYVSCSIVGEIINIKIA